MRHAPCGDVRRVVVAEVPLADVVRGVPLPLQPQGERVKPQVQA